MILAAQARGWGGWGWGAARVCARVTHRLVNNLNDAGLQLGHDRRVAGGDTVLTRAARDDHLAKKREGDTENHSGEEVGGTKQHRPRRSERAV